MAINFNKNFRVFELSNNIQSNTRMLNLLESLELEEFLISNEYNHKVPNWEKVNDKLSNFREMSLEYIKNICTDN